MRVTDETGMLLPFPVLLVCYQGMRTMIKKKGFPCRSFLEKSFQSVEVHRLKKNRSFILSVSLLTRVRGLRLVFPSCPWISDPECITVYIRHMLRLSRR